MSNILSGGFSAARSFLRRGEPVPEPQPRTTLTVIPMFHVTACSASLMGAMAAGHTTIFMRKWDAVEAMEIIEREKVNVTRSEERRAGQEGGSTCRSWWSRYY